MTGGYRVQQNGLLDVRGKVKPAKIMKREYHAT